MAAPVDRFACRMNAAIETWRRRYFGVSFSNHDVSRRVSLMRPGVVVGGHYATGFHSLLTALRDRPCLRAADGVDAGQAGLPAERTRFDRDQLERPVRQRRLAVRHREGLPHVGLASRTGRHGGVEGRLPGRTAGRSRRGTVDGARPADRPLRRNLSQWQARRARLLQVERHGELRGQLRQRRAAGPRHPAHRRHCAERRVEQGLPGHGREDGRDRRVARVVRSLTASAPAPRPGPRPRSDRRD